MFLIMIMGIYPVKKTVDELKSNGEKSRASILGYTKTR